jgi:hypothetical protein
VSTVSSNLFFNRFVQGTTQYLEGITKFTPHFDQQPLRDTLQKSVHDGVTLQQALAQSTGDLAQQLKTNWLKSFKIRTLAWVETVKTYIKARQALLTSGDPAIIWQEIKPFVEKYQTDLAAKFKLAENKNMAANMFNNLGDELSKNNKGAIHAVRRICHGTLVDDAFKSLPGLVRRFM